MRAVCAYCGANRSSHAERLRPRVWENISLAQTTMSNPGLPPEILDYIVDFLQDDLLSLEQCCLVSKSWVPRARRHIFYIIEFETQEDLDKWKKAFPDPSNSPAQYTRILVMSYFRIVVEEDVTEGGWIPTFPRAMHLELRSEGRAYVPELDVSLTPFSKLSPNVKSLSVVSFLGPRLQVFNLIRSLPFLEDLSLVCCVPAKGDDGRDGPQTAVPSPISPKLTGTLELLPLRDMAVTVRRLLDLPSGIHFRTLELSWYEEGEHHYLTELVVACSDTLESLDVTYELKGAVYPFFFLFRYLLEH